MYEKIGYWAGIIGAIISLISLLITIFGYSNKIIFIISLCFILLVFSYSIYYFKTMKLKMQIKRPILWKIENSKEILAEIIEGLNAIKNELYESNFTPDIVITLGLCAAFSGGMLAYILNRNNLCSFSREEIQDGEINSIFYFPQFASLNKDWLENKKILFFVFSNRSFRTLKMGMKMLEKYKNNLKIYVLYQEKGAYDAVSNKIRFIYLKNNVEEEVLNKMPWINDEKYVTAGKLCC